MKRLTLNAFQAKNTTTAQTQKVDQLLGQVLGDCHDGHGNGGGGHKIQTKEGIPPDQQRL